MVRIWIRYLERFCKENKIDTYWMSMRNPYSIESHEQWFGAPENNSDIPSKDRGLKNMKYLNLILMRFY